jgi:hypothetical protein
VTGALGRLAALSTSFVGHYVLLTGYSFETDEVEIIDPSARVGTSEQLLGVPAHLGDGCSLYSSIIPFLVLFCEPALGFRHTPLQRAAGYRWRILTLRGAPKARMRTCLRSRCRWGGQGRVSVQACLAEPPTLFLHHCPQAQRSRAFKFEQAP